MKKLASILVVTLSLLAGIPAFAGTTQTSTAVAVTSSTATQFPTTQPPGPPTPAPGTTVCVGDVCFTIPPIFLGIK
jgi:hypothetical protein